VRVDANDPSRPAPIKYEKTFRVEDEVEVNAKRYINALRGLWKF
jgi:hypothetical protein